jgi:hypothetical protein
MGKNIDMLCRHVVVSDDQSQPPQEESLDAPEGTDGWVTKYRRTYCREEHLRIKNWLAALVGMRNSLIHHFLQRHDLQSESGCEAALVVLETQRTEFETYRLWLRDLDRDAKKMTVFAEWFASSPQGPNNDDHV